MSRRWGSKEAETNLFEYGEQQRRAAADSAKLLQQMTATLSEVRIERNRLRVALQDILEVSEPAGEKWIAGKCREALGMPKAQDIAHQKSQGEQCQSE